MPWRVVAKHLGELGRSLSLDRGVFKSHLFGQKQKQSRQRGVRGRMELLKFEMEEEEGTRVPRWMNITGSEGGRKIFNLLCKHCTRL